MSDFFAIFRDTYLPMSYTLYTMYYLSMYYVRFSLTYLPTQKSDTLYERSDMEKKTKAFAYRVPIGDYKYLQCGFGLIMALASM